MKSKLRQFQQKYGGSSFLDFKGYVVLAILSALSSITLIHPSTNPLVWLGVYGANILSLALCAVWFVVCSRLIFRNRATRPASLWSMLGAGAVLGAIKAISTGYLLVAFGQEANLATAIGQRLPAATFLGMIGVIGLAIQENTLRNFRAEHKALVIQLAQHRMATSVNQYRNSAVSELKKFIRSAKQQLETRPKTGNANDYANALRKLVDSDLRPLSHRLWQEPATTYPDISFRSLSKLAVTQVKPKANVVTLIYLAGVLTTLVNRLPFFDTLLVAGTESLIVFAGVSLASKYQPKRQSTAWWYFFATCTVTAFAAFYSVQSLSLVPHYMTYWTAAVGTAIWLIDVNFLARFFDAAIATNSGMRAELERLISEDLLASVANQSQGLIESRELADYLHGKMQNVFLTAALRANDSPEDEANLKDVIAEVNQMLDTAVATFVDPKNTSLDQALTDLVSIWAGFVNVEYRISPAEAAIDQISALALAKIASEAVTNSVRHGLASNVLIEVDAENLNQISITATDDGLGPRNEAPGLGTQLLNSMAGRRWVLVPGTSGGAVLHVSLARP